MKKDIVINEPTPNPTKNNPNSYRFKCKYKDQHNGLKIETTYPRWKDEKEAKSQRAQWLTDYGKNAGHFAPPEVKTPEPVKLLTFADYSEPYLKKLLRNTKSESYTSEMKILLKFFGKHIFSEIKRKDIEDFTIWIADQRTPETMKEVELHNGKWRIKETVKQVPYSWSTRNHFIKRLSAMNNTAILEEMPEVKRINFSGFKKPKLENVRTFTISYAEIEFLLENCYKSNLRLELIGLFELGCRLCELKAIKREDFNMPEVLSVGRVLNSKKKIDAGITKRPVYFSKRIREEIYKYHGLTESQFKQMPPETSLFDTKELRTAWEGLRKRVAIKYAEQGDVATANKILNLQEKDFRTSHRTNLKNARIMADFKDVQTGHNQDSITAKHYEHSDYEEIHEEFQLYENYSARQRAKIQKAMTAAG